LVGLPGVRTSSALLRGARRRAVTEITLFPFAQYWWFYLAFLGGVLILLALDLGVFHREAHEVSFREAAIWSAVWVGLALAFGYGLYQYALWQFPQDPRLAALPGFDPTAAARDATLEFLTGYIVEYSLSVDNIFIFVLVLTYLPFLKYQHRILFYGISARSSSAPSSSRWDPS
jgi:tellurite resistance protein TerC